MNKPLITGILLSAMTASAYAQVVDFYTATPKLLDGNVIEFDGIRVEVNDLKVNKDAVKVRFVFNPATLNFELDMDSLVVYPNVGIFNEEHIVLNVPAMSLGQDDKGRDIETRHPPYTANADLSTYVKGETIITPAFTPILADSKQYSVTTTPGTPFVADFNLEKGHVMSLYLARPRKEGMTYQFTGPETEVTGTVEAGKTLLLDPIKILLPGAYQLQVSPLKIEESVKFSFKIFNANNNDLKELKDGDKVRANFSANTWDYAKFKVTLDPEDTLKLPGVTRKRKEDGDNYQAINDRQQNVALKLVDETNHIIAYADDFGALTYYHTKPTQNFYLFIYNKVGSGGNYSTDTKTAEITNPNKPKSNPKPQPKPQPEPQPEAEQPAPDVEEPPVDDEALSEAEFETELAEAGSEG